MQIKLQEIQTFGAGVKAFRVLPGPAASATAPASAAPVTERSKRFAENLRARIREQDKGK